jgi:ferredoxin-NADP reductase
MVPARRDWQEATAVAFRKETAKVSSITFHVPEWSRHSAGQHVDVRLTAPDGYQAERSYSIASPAGDAKQIELTVERIDSGEVSPFLTGTLVVGDSLELRGPLASYFTWDPSGASPLMLIAGGSGVVPLMSMLRTRHNAGSKIAATLLYSSRSAEDIIYRQELDCLASNRDGFTLVHTLTRAVPAGWQGEHRRVDTEMLAAHVFPATQVPQIFICGPTAFVEAVADQLVALGHAESAIKTERFGPTGEKR